MWLWLLSPIGRKVAGAVLGVVLLLGCVWYIYNRGKDAGRIEGAADQLQQDRKQFEQDRQQFLATLKHYQEEDDAAKQVIAQKDGELAQLKSRRIAQQKAIESLPDAQIVGDINARLGIKPEEPLSPGTLRLLDEAVADTENLKQQVAGLEAKSQAQDQRIAALEHQRDAAVDAYNKLVPLYTKAYNAAQKRPNWFLRVITLGRYKGKHLDLPAPVSLQSLP